jgi:hypothetical protein
MLEPNCYIYGVQLFKNKNSVAYVGPGRIFLNPNTSQFTIGIPNKAPFGSGVSLGMRKVQCYVQNCLDYKTIPYLNSEVMDNSVNWESLELAYVETVNFAKMNEKKSENIEKYLNGDYSFSNNMSINNANNSNSGTGMNLGSNHGINIGNNLNNNHNNNHNNNQNNNHNNNHSSNPFNPNLSTTNTTTSNTIAAANSLSTNINNTVINNRFTSNNTANNVVTTKKGGMLLEIDMSTSNPTGSNTNITNNSNHNIPNAGNISNSPNPSINTINKLNTSAISASSTVKRNNLFFNPAFNRSNTGNKNSMMNPIPEENSFLNCDSVSNYNSLSKIHSNLNNISSAMNAPSAFNNNFNNMLDSQLKSNLGNKLQQAEMMRSNNRSINNMNNNSINTPLNAPMNSSMNPSMNKGFLTSNNISNNNTLSNGSNIPASKSTFPGNNNSFMVPNVTTNNLPSIMSNNNSTSLFNNPSNNLSNLPSNNIPLNKYMSNSNNIPLSTSNNIPLSNSNNIPLSNSNNIPLSNSNNIPLSTSNNMSSSLFNVPPRNSYPSTSTAINNNIPNLLPNTPRNTLSNLPSASHNVQNIPLNTNFKSLLSLKSGLNNTFNNNFNNNNFLSNNTHALIIKDPSMNINLTRNSDSIGSNMQQTTIIPQTRMQFVEIINNMGEKLKNIKNIKNNKNVLNNINNINPPPQTTSKNHLLKSSIKFAEEPRKKDTNIYNIDYYIFKEALNQQSDKPLLPYIQIEEEKKHVNEKILETLSRRYLSENELKGNSLSNPVFEELYLSMSCHDIIITIKNEDILAHKVVLISQSQVFKEMIQKNEKNEKNQNFQNLQNLQNFSNEIIKIILPETYKPSAFREVLKWIYCGKISENLEINFLREMLIISDNLKIFPLQRILIVKFIIPNMTKEFSIKFLKDAYKKSTTSETAEVWTLLANFSLNCIAKNSSILIKNNRNEFLGMEMDLLFKVVERSVFYLVEDIHLSNLIKIIIDRGFATDVFDLLIKLGKEYNNARSCNIQNVNLENMLRNIDSSMPGEFPLINEDVISNNLSNNHVGSKTNKNQEIKSNTISKNLNKFADNENREIKDNSSNINNQQLNNIELAKDKVDIIDLKKLTSSSPATNYVKGIELRKNKSPSLSFSFTINYDNLSSCTILSESFNTNSRSWNLKIDLTTSGDVSFYLVERGSPVHLNNNILSSYFYQDKFSLKFNSVLFEFEIRDISFEKSSVIFFSFVSDHNQVVGYENFFNVKQLGKKENFIFNIWIKEFPLHSACLQYITDNFQQLAEGKKKIEAGGSANNTNTTVKSFYDLPPPEISYILSSDNLRVENENIVLTTVYRYTINKPSTDIDCIMSSIRYKFVDLKILCTTARDHEAIKNSNSFKKNFQNEISRRIFFEKGGVSGVSKGKGKEKRNNFFSEIRNECEVVDECEEENYRYLSEMVGNRQNKERKYYCSKEEKGKVFNITSELASFFLDKDHHSGYVKEIERVRNF